MDYKNISDAEREALYRAAVGSKADYYVPKFMAYDAGGSRASWNWPAFFVTFFWMLYRRMYGWGAAYFFGFPTVFFVLTGILGIVAALLMQQSPVAITAVYIGLLLLAQVFVWIVTPMYANSLYHRSVNQRIRQMSYSAPSTQVVMDRLVMSSSNSAGPIIAIVAACFITIFMAGILAAIAIPAYQDYTIRAQVTEGLVMARGVKAAVAEARARDGVWPADLAAAAEGEAGALTGKYVDAIAVDHGTVVIQYGGQAHRIIAGHTLTLHPMLTASEDVVWTCGWADPPEGVSADASPSGNQFETDIPPKYLPRECRGTAST